MKLRLTQKQRMWANIFQCAVQRSNICLKENDRERKEREMTTAVLALQKSDQFWKQLL